MTVHSSKMVTSPHPHGLSSMHMRFPCVAPGSWWQGTETLRASQVALSDHRNCAFFRVMGCTALQPSIGQLCVVTWSVLFPATTTAMIVVFHTELGE